MRTRTILFLSLGIALLIGIGAAFAILFGLFRSPLEGEKSFDFGIVQIERPHTVLEHTFTLINRTNHTLKLADAVPTCGCTTTDWPEEPVGVGEELLVPVHLKIQRSHLRTSKVRLTFETGEVVVLFIEGTGRFKQPLRALPPTIKVVDGLKDGSRNMLILEWYELSSPDIPTFVTPEHVRVEPEKWVLGKRSDQKLGTPSDWTLQIYTYLEGNLAEGSSLLIEMVNTPPLRVPIEQAEHADRPRPILDPNFPTAPNVQ